jgi:uncharacterized protein (TIGR03437 family)
MTALAVDPRNGDVVYAGSSGGGVWKTIDGGKNWSAVTDAQPSLSIGSLAIDPSNPDTIYAGTGFLEPEVPHLYYGAGILKSTDAGATWKNLPGPFAGPLDSATGGADVISLAVDPGNRQVLLAAVAGGGSLASGVYRSGDGGVTWTNVLNGGQATAVLFDPRNGTIAYAGVGLGTRNGVYKSFDSGATWNLLSGGSSPLPTANLGRTLIAIAASNPSVLYVSITKDIGGNTNGSLVGLFKTTDGGQNWKLLPNVPDICSSNPGDPAEGGAPQCFRRGVLQVSPIDPNVVFAGAREILVRTMDGGASWEDVTAGTIEDTFIHPDQSALAFSSDGAALYVADDGGVTRTASTTTHPPLPWIYLSASLGAVSFSPGISIHPADTTITYAGPQEGGLASYRGSLAWQGVICGDGAVTAMDPQNPNTIYAACQPDISDGLYKTTTGGLTRQAWAPAQTGIDFSDRRDYVRWYWSPLVIDPSNTKTLYYASYRIYQTKDSAGTWIPISGDLTGGTGGISAIGVAPTKSDTVYAGTTTGFVFVTLNSGSGPGATWTSRSSGLPPRPITQIVVTPVDPLTAFASAAGFSGFSGDSNGHLFKTTNGGQNWTDVSGNLPNFPVNDIALDPDISNAMYVGTDIGVFGTVDGGKTWSAIGTGLPHVRITALRLHRASRILRAATYGRGMWDLFVSVSATNPKPIITSVSRSTFKVGEAGAVLKVTGSGFVGDSAASLNGSRLSPLLVNLSTLLVPIPPSALSESGNFALTVTNPQPGGGPSDEIPIQVIPPKPPLALQLICCTAQKRPGGSTALIGLDVGAVDADSTPLAGISVTFTPVFGGGSVSVATAKTDADTGQTSSFFKVGPTDGVVNVVTATAEGFSPVSFMEGSPFAAGFGPAGGGQTAPANTELGKPLSVSVTDPSGNPVPGVPVVWRVSSGGGFISPAVTLTDNGGNASAAWTLGPVVGTQTVTFDVGFAVGIQMTATATAGTIMPNVAQGGIINSAGFNNAVAAVSPGTIATVFGTRLSNAPPEGVVPPQMQGIPLLRTISSGTQVTFDGIPAPLFYVSPMQINLQVPFEVAGKTSSQVIVNVSGNNSAPVTVPILGASPAFFTSDSSGAGPAAALNQDGSRNSPDNRASPGSVIVLFATGMGRLPSSVATGWVAPGFPALAYNLDAPVVTIGGLGAAVQFCGLAPGFVGLWQINVVVPSGSPSGEQPLSISARGQNGNPVTIYVK